MSHQSGIKPSADLVSQFTLAVKSGVRGFVAQIAGDLVEIITAVQSKSSVWTQDLAAFKPQGAAFVLVRDDAGKWVLFQYIPDTSSVRDKMIYASTRNTLTKVLGESNFSHMIMCSALSEISEQGFLEYTAHQDAPPPLTEREVEAAAIKESNSTVDISIDSRTSNAPGLSVPLGPVVGAALKGIKEGGAVSFSVATQACELVAKLDAGTPLVKLAPVDTPFFAVFWAGDSFGFVFCSPPATPIRQRMVFAASRASVLQQVEAVVGPIKKRFEVDSVPELESSLAQEEVRDVKVAFRKPKAPGRK